MAIVRTMTCDACKRPIAPGARYAAIIVDEESAPTPERRSGVRGRRRYGDDATAPRFGELDVCGDCLEAGVSIVPREAFG